MDEFILFNLVQDGKLWFIFVSFEIYELLYCILFVSKVDNVNILMIFKIDNGVYVSIYEVVLIDFFEMILKYIEGCYFKLELVFWFDGVKVCFVGGIFVILWCSIQIVFKVVGLINFGLILNLNEFCVLEGDLSWICFMKYVGIWWGMYLGVEMWMMDECYGVIIVNVK